jgi:hypothetical protein
MLFRHQYRSHGEAGPGVAIPVIASGGLSNMTTFSALCAVEQEGDRRRHCRPRHL